VDRSRYRMSCGVNVNELVLCSIVLSIFSLSLCAVQLICTFISICIYISVIDVDRTLQNFKKIGKNAIIELLGNRKFIGDIQCKVN